MSKFHVGDRVRVKYYFDDLELEGEIGTVIENMFHGFYDVAVEFDDEIEYGHDANGAGKEGHCRFDHGDELELIDDCEFPLFESIFDD